MKSKQGRCIRNLLIPDPNIEIQERIPIFRRRSLTIAQFLSYHFSFSETPRRDSTTANSEHHAVFIRNTSRIETETDKFVPRLRPFSMDHLITSGNTSSQAEASLSLRTENVILHTASPLS